MRTVNENPLKKLKPLKPIANNIKNAVSGIPLFSIFPAKMMIKLSRAHMPAANKAIL